MTDDALPPTAKRLPGPLSRLGISVVLLTLLVDQVSKLMAVNWLPFGESKTLLPILELYLTANNGIAFSLLAGVGSTGVTIATLTITAIVIVFWARTREGGRLPATGFALIVGGAIGNLADRLFRGHVIDFLHLHVGDRTLFVFNLADVALTLGPIALIAAFLFEGRPGLFR